MITAPATPARQLREAAGATRDAEAYRWQAQNLRRLATDPPPGMTADFPKYARQAAQDCDERVEERAAFAAAAGTTWGAQFILSDAWRRRRNHITDGSASIGGYLEERAITSADVAYGVQPLLQPGGPSPAVAPIAARCTPSTAQPRNAGYVRWPSGPLRPLAPTDEGAAKPASAGAPQLMPLLIPFVATYVEVTRQCLEDQQAVATIVDSRLRRSLGAALDDAVVAALDADTDIPAAATVWRAIADLWTDGYVTGLTVICNPDDYEQVQAGLQLPMSTSGLATEVTLSVAGMTAVMPSPACPAGTAFAGDLAAAVAVISTSPAAISTGTGPVLTISDSNEEDFLRNVMVMRAEARMAAAVSDPSAVRRAAVTTSETRGWSSRA